MKTLQLVTVSCKMNSMYTYTFLQIFYALISLDLQMEQSHSSILLWPPPPFLEHKSFTLVTMVTTFRDLLSETASVTGQLVLGSGIETSQVV